MHCVNLGQRSRLSRFAATARDAHDAAIESAVEASRHQLIAERRNWDVEQRNKRIQHAPAGLQRALFVFMRVYVYVVCVLFTILHCV